MAAAAVLALAATPAYAQNVNANSNGVYGQVELRSGYEPDPYMVTVLGGGPVDASRLGEACNGFIAQRASFTLRYTAGELPLYIGANSDADTTIAVRAPNGEWLCNDDSSGLNPMVSWESPRSGRYQIWVGRYGAQDESAAAMLYISEIGAASHGGGGGSGGAPNWMLDPAYGTLELTAGFTPDPHTVEIAAGGSIDASSVLGESGCVGWIAEAPDYRLNWTAGSGELPLIFSVTSQSDTTLVINDAQGNWLCDDDGGNEGLNPAISITGAVSGQYDIWVGTYAQGDLQPSTLHISELYSQ